MKVKILVTFEYCAPVMGSRHCFREYSRTMDLPFVPFVGMSIELHPSYRRFTDDELTAKIEDVLWTEDEGFFVWLEDKNMGLIAKETPSYREWIKSLGFVPSFPIKVKEQKGKK